MNTEGEGFPGWIPLDGEAGLRALEQDQADAIFALVSNNREHLGRWLPWVETTHEPADTAAFLRQAAENRSRGRTAAYAIWAEGGLRGIIGLHDIDRSNGVAQIGYWIAADWQGRGLVTRAVRALLHLAFADLRLERIEIRCATGNLRSQAVPKRLGFTCEGRLRAAQRLHGQGVDMLVYGLLREEWRRLRRASGEQI